MIRFNFEQHQRRIALNPHQNIIKIVGNPTGQCPDGFHLLGLVQLGFQFMLFFFRFFPFGNVAQHTPVTHGQSVLIFQK